MVLSTCYGPNSKVHTGIRSMREANKVSALLGQSTNWRPALSKATSRTSEEGTGQGEPLCEADTGDLEERMTET